MMKVMDKSTYKLSYFIFSHKFLEVRNALNNVSYLALFLLCLKENIFALQENNSDIKKLKI